LGFLRFNWHPATIFMGDAGSLFIGFLLAALGLMVISPSAEFSGTWLVPVVILAVPIFDTTLVTFSRLRRQLKLTDGGRDHTSHRLVRMGLTVPQGVGRIYKAAGVCNAVGVAIALNPSWAIAAPIVMILGLLAIAAFFWFEQVDLSDTGQPTPDSHRTRLVSDSESLASPPVYKQTEV
jgi:UDP-GlcNAc:undecaprenyl-phosphate GlcNAc-1-phosphate transferase